MKRTKKLTFCAILSSLSVVILLFGSFLDVMDLTAVALATLGVFLILEELDWHWALGSYTVTGALSLLLLPNKIIAAEYLILGGCYPILKRWFEKLPKVLSWVAKLLYANAATALLYVLYRFVFLTEVETGWLLAAVFALANAVLVLYDYCLNILRRVYVLRFRSRLGLDRFFRK